MRRPSATAELLVATVAFSAISLFPSRIHGDAFAISFGRAAFAFVGLLIVALATRQSFAKPERRDLLPLAATALFNALNWVTIFAAIQVAGIAVAVISLFTYPLLTALLEPVVSRKPHDRFEVMAGLAVVLGVFLVVPRFDFSDRTFIGVLLGVSSALAFTFRNLIGRPLVPKYGAVPTMLWQFAFAIPFFAPFGLPLVARWTLHDWLLLFVMGAVLTAFSQTLFLSNLKRVTSSYASLITSAQPVISVALAMMVNGERPTARTLLGGAVVTLSVLAVALRKRTPSLNDRPGPP
ncbi:DMT family transporter [bacterium]|nr:MAG: DMT family transporter [bacterium]